MVFESGFSFFAKIFCFYVLCLVELHVNLLSLMLPWLALVVEWGVIPNFWFYFSVVASFLLTKFYSVFLASPGFSLGDAGIAICRFLGLSL